MESTYYVLEKIPDLTLSKYSSLDENGVKGVLSHHSTFWRQMNRRGLLLPECAHLFYEYDPTRKQGERLRTGIRIDTKYPADQCYLREMIQCSPLSMFYEFRQCRETDVGNNCNSLMPNIHRRYQWSVHLTRKERMSRPLDPGDTEKYYTVSEWEMNEEARLYNMARLMASAGKPCLYILSAYPVDLTGEMEETLFDVLTKLRNLTRIKLNLSSSGTGQGQKDENADDALHFYSDLLKTLAANPHFLCDMQVLSDDCIHAGYILDAAVSEALSEGDHTLKQTPGYSFAEITGDVNNFPALPMAGTPKGLIYLSQLYTLDEMVPFGIMPALFPGETLETPKETLPDLNKSGLLLGEDTDHHRIEFPLSNLSKHAFLAGVPGSGKTNSMMHLIAEMHIQHGIPVLVLEPAKHEYRVLTTLPDMSDLELFSPGAYTRFPLHINPFEFPIGLSLAEHIRNLLAVFDGAFNLEPPMPFLLDQSVDAVYRKHNWTHSMINQGKLSYPTMSELYKELEKRLDKSDYAPEIKGNLKSALQVRIGSLMVREMGDIFDVPHSTFAPEEWIKRSAVVELEALGKDPANYMTLLIATLIRETLKVENYDKKAMNGKPRHVMFLEEAHNLIGPVAQPSAESQADPKTAATAYIVKMLAEVRALGEGIVIADQLPTAMAPEVIKNTSLKIGLRITAEDDRQLLGGTMSANPDQLEKMAVFSPGQALCSYEPLLKPFEIQIPYFEAKEGNLDDAMIIQSLGANERYQKDLLTSFKICAEKWDKKWEKLVKNKGELLKAKDILDSTPEKTDYNVLLKRINTTYKNIVEDAYDIKSSVYSFLSPWAAIKDNADLFGPSKEQQKFFKNTYYEIASKGLEYKNKVAMLIENCKKWNLKYPEEAMKMQEEKKNILISFLPSEREAWEQAAENAKANTGNSGTV